MKTAAQHDLSSQLIFYVSDATVALGPAEIGPALHEAMTAAPLNVPTLRYLSRMLDRLADQREREAGQ